MKASIVCYAALIKRCRKVVSCERYAATNVTRSPVSGASERQLPPGAKQPGCKPDQERELHPEGRQIPDIQKVFLAFAMTISRSLKADPAFFS